MKGSFGIGRVLGIPIQVHVSWFLTLAFVTAILALKVYPDVLVAAPRYRNDTTLHWVMAFGSGLAFFGSIILHELAHSIVARKQGVTVKGITLFVFGGVAQITSEAKRPLHEFLMALVGPLTSVVLAGVFFLLWWLVGGFTEDRPLPIVLEWLFLMNLIVGAFNMAPGFPMDGGRVLRSLIWGATGNYNRATRAVTLLGRGLGYTMMAVGLIAGLRVFSFIDPWSGLWMFILGLFLENAARRSWLQTQAMSTLGVYRAEQVMTRDIDTVAPEESLSRVLSEHMAATGGRFIVFVSNDERVLGVVTEKELRALPTDAWPRATASDAMVAAEKSAVAAPEEDAARMLEKMEAAEVWHLPVVREGRVLGVVNREALLRLLARRLQQRSLAGQP